MKDRYQASTAKNMKHVKLLTSACRYCQYYKPEGRRGGLCQQLGAPVQGSWKACSLAIPPFAPSWESLPEDVWMSTAVPVLTSEVKKPVVNVVAEVTCTNDIKKAEPVLV